MKKSSVKAKPPTGIDPIRSSGESGPVYHLIRDAIIEGRANATQEVVKMVQPESSDEFVEVAAG